MLIPLISILGAIVIVASIVLWLEKRKQNKKCCLIIKNQRKWITLFLLVLMVGCSSEYKEPDTIAGAESTSKVSFPVFPQFPAVFQPTQSPTSTTTTTTTTKGTTEVCSYAGRFNGDRATWYCKKKMNQYPSRLTVVIPGCVTKTISNNGSRYDSGGLIVKQSEVSGRGMAIVIESSCKSKSASVRY